MEMTLVAIAVFGLAVSALLVIGLCRAAGRSITAHRTALASSRIAGRGGRAPRARRPSRSHRWALRPAPTVAVMLLAISMTSLASSDSPVAEGLALLPDGEGSPGGVARGDATDRTGTGAPSSPPQLSNGSLPAGTPAPMEEEVATPVLPQTPESLHEHSPAPSVPQAPDATAAPADHQDHEVALEPSVAPASQQPPTESTLAPAGTHSGHGGQGPVAGAARVDPVNCSGYPEPRVFVETQDWWLRTPGANGTDFGHVHLGTCFPHGQTVSGTVEFDIKVMLHNNPGTLTHVTGLLVTGGGEFDVFDVGVNLRCPGQTCEKWVHATANTAVADVDGRAEWRLRPRVEEPDGKQMAPSTGWQTYLANGGGRPESNYRDSDAITSRGWYEDAGYANATLSPVPYKPVSGVWTPSVTLDRGDEGGPVTFHTVRIDANFHMGIGGIVVREGAGPFRGELRIDTRTLPNGVHRLFLRADSDQPSGSTHSGVLTILFTVAN